MEIDGQSNRLFNRLAALRSMAKNTDAQVTGNILFGSQIVIPSGFYMKMGKQY